ncbi:MAG: hypothetical protein ACJAS4_003180 [Bacteriovoracaceae bacterium]|jgi:hypothetical protein
MTTLNYRPGEKNIDRLRFNQLFSTFLSLLPTLIFLFTKIVIWKVYCFWVDFKAGPSEAYRDREYIKDAEIYSYLELKL